MKPVWLRRKAPDPDALKRIRYLLGRLRLNTVCQGALCPNQGECFGTRDRDFLDPGRNLHPQLHLLRHPLGGAPPAPDPGEPERIAQAAAELGLDIS